MDELHLNLEEDNMINYQFAEQKGTILFCRIYYHHESEDRPTDCNPLFSLLPRTRNLDLFVWKIIQEHQYQIEKNNWGKAMWHNSGKETKMFFWIYFMRSWNQFCWRRNTKLRSRSLSMVVSSTSPSDLSVVRPSILPTPTSRWPSVCA